MPPKKRIKLLNYQNVVMEDTDSGSSDTGDLTVGKKAVVGSSATTTAQEEDDTEAPQPVMGFVSQQELAKYARGLNIKRVMLADLGEQSDLDGGYVGGQVIGHYSKSYSQGHDVNVFIQDESTTEGSQHKHLLVTFTERLANEMPALRDDIKLFLYNAVVKEDSSTDFSQDHGKCLLMDRDDAQVWIVHRDVRKEGFFRKSFGKKWWAKTKQNREKIKAMWSVESAVSVGPSKELQAGSSTSGLTSAGPPHEDRPDYTSSKDPIGAYSSVPAKPKRSWSRRDYRTGKKYITRSVVSASMESRGESSTSGDRVSQPASEIGRHFPLGPTSDSAALGTTSESVCHGPTSDSAALSPTSESGGRESGGHGPTSDSAALSPASEPGGHSSKSDSAAPGPSRGHVPERGSGHIADESLAFPDNPDFPDSAFNNESNDDNDNDDKDDDDDDDDNDDDDDDDITESSSDASIDSETSSGGDSDREWNRRQQQQRQQQGKPGTTGRAYKYRKLQDLSIGDKKVNIIGLVKYFKPPALTRGTDYYSVLTLLDESEPRVGIKCIMFNRNTEKLPQVKRVGDIICLHRVNVGSYNCQVQVQGVRFSSAIRFSGEVSKKVSPCTGSASFTCTSLEKQRVKELRLWAKKQRREAMHCLRAVLPGEYLDLACQVVSVTISKVPRCTVLTVWDATPHALRCKRVKMKKSHEDGYPIVKDDSTLSEDSEGYHVYVVVYDKKCRIEANNLSPGQFVLLQSLHSSVPDSDNLVEICMHEKENRAFSDWPPPRIVVLDKKDELCTTLVERIRHSLEPVTVTYHEDQPLFTVAYITSYAGPFPMKFRCRVKVQRITSPSLEDMAFVLCNQCHHAEAISPAKEMDPDGTARNLCTVCGGSSGEKPTCHFNFNMAVDDRTGFMEVEVAYDSALQLFNNLKPNNFYQYQELRYQLLEKLHSLTGGSPPFATADTATAGGRPVVEVCVCALEHEGTAHYLLFDTELRPNCITL